MGLTSPNSDHCTKTQKGSGLCWVFFVLFFFLCVCAANQRWGIKAIFEFQGQQEDLIKVSKEVGGNLWSPKPKWRGQTLTI